MPQPRLSNVMDWRELKYREELFFRYFTWRVKVHDLDHSHYCQTLTYGMDNEQKTWFSFLFGMTYRTPQAYAYWSIFPDFNDLDMKEVEQWNTDNWKRTSYGTDARYNKGHFAKQTQSIKNWVGEKTLYEKVKSLVNSPNPSVNFERLFEGVSSLFKYGRMTGWITCQCLYDVLGLRIDFNNVLIRNPSSDSSMQSVWNGYCMLKGQYSRLLGKYAKEKYTPSEADVKEISAEIMKYRELAVKYSGHDVDVFKWESIWCQFKRLFNDKESKEYPGHSSGDATSRYEYYRENWSDVDWTLFRKALLSQPSIIRGQTFVNDYNKVFGETGLLLNMHEMFSDMPNAYEKLGLDPNENLVEVLFEDEGERVPCL